MATKYSEAVLAVKYRVIDENGEMAGGLCITSKVVWAADGWPGCSPFVGQWRHLVSAIWFRSTL